MKCKQRWKTVASCLLAALLFPGCSDEEGGGTAVEEEKYRTIVITLNSLENSEMGTRAGNDVDDPDKEDSDDEHHISNYLLLVLKQEGADGTTGEPVYILDRIIDSTEPGAVKPSNDNEDSKTKLTVEVEIGQTYRFMALANLDGLENKNDITNKLNELVGVQFDPTTFQATVKEMTKYPHDTEADTYIPMSSYWYELFIQPSTGALEDDIELIRLIGKATVTITNLTKEAVTINNLTMQDMRKGEIYLFPYDVNEVGTDGEPLRHLFDKSIDETYAPKFPTGTTGEKTFAQFVIPDDKKEIASNDEVEYPSVYLPETSWDDNADLTITADISGRNPHPQTIHTSFVRRNDWLKIPILIQPVTTKISFEQQHMPIGGLPTELFFASDEPVVAVAPLTTSHAGKITVNFSLTVDNDELFTDPVLLTEGIYAAGTEWSKATVVDNPNGVILEVEKGSKIDLTIDETNRLSGSFELTLQEMSTLKTAEIELLLVVVEKSDIDENKIGPDSKRLAIPYTIQITYDNTK